MPLIIEKGNPMAKTPIGKEILSGDPKKGAEAFQQIMDSVADMDPIPYMIDPKIWPLSLGEAEGSRQQAQRSGQVHHADRVRMDLAGHVRKHAPQCILP